MKKNICQRKIFINFMMKMKKKLKKIQKSHRYNYRRKNSLISQNHNKQKKMIKNTLDSKKQLKNQQMLNKLTLNG